MSDFDPDTYLAQKSGGAFNPDRYLAEKTGDDNKMNPVLAAANGLGQGATMGFGDELSGAVGGALDKVLPESLGGAQAGKSYAQLYQENRDMARQLNARSMRDQPGAFLAGNVVGGVASSALLPGAGAGANAGARLISAAKTGAALGAAGGLGSSNADLLQGDVAGAARDTGTGALLGAAAGGAGQLAGEGLQAVAGGASQTARDFAEKQATSALRPTAGQIKTLLNKDQIQPLGRFLLKSGAVGAGDTPEAIALNLEGLQASGGHAYQQALQELDKTNLPAIDSGTLINTLNDLRLEAERGGPALKPLADKYEAALLDAMGPALGRVNPGSQFSDAEMIKRGFQKVANYSTMNPSLAGEADIKIASAYRQAVEDAADDAAKTSGQPDLAERFKAAKDLYSKSSQALGLTEGAEARSLARNIASPSDKAAGAAAALQAQAQGKSAVSSGLTGLAVGAVNNAVRRRAASTLAAAAEGASTKLQRIAMTSPGKLGAYGALLSGALRTGGQQAFNAHVFTLGQTDPKFQAMQQRLAQEHDDEQ